MTAAALSYLRTRFPVFPNVVGGVVMFVAPAALGIASAAKAPGPGPVALGLLLFVSGLFAMRVADDLVDWRADAGERLGPDRDRSRLRAMTALAAAAALLILVGAVAVRGGWLMALFLAWLALVSVTLNRRASIDSALQWLANEPLYLVLLLFAYAAGAGSLPSGPAGLCAIAGNWLMIESWEVGRKCFAPQQPGGADLYTRRLGPGGARALFGGFYLGGAVLLACAAAAAGLGFAAAWLIAAAGAVLLVTLRTKPVAALLAFFLLANLSLAAGALSVRYGG